MTGLSGTLAERRDLRAIRAYYLIFMGGSGSSRLVIPRRG